MNYPIPLPGAFDLAEFLEKEIFAVIAQPKPLGRGIALSKEEKLGIYNFLKARGWSAHEAQTAREWICNGDWGTYKKDLEKSDFTKHEKQIAYPVYINVCRANAQLKEQVEKLKQQTQAPVPLTAMDDSTRMIVQQQLQIHELKNDVERKETHVRRLQSLMGFFKPRRRMAV